MLVFEKQKKIMRKSIRLVWYFPLCYYCSSGAAGVLFIGFYSLRHQSKSVWNSNEEFISEKGHILQHLKFIIQHLSIQRLKLLNILFMKTFFSKA